MPQAANDPLQLAGTIIADKYRVERLAGEGGFSVVYRARHLTWDQVVALKFFRLPNDPGDEARRAMVEAFIREGKLMIELSTQTTSVVQARDVGTLTRSDGEVVPFMVLESLEGSSLDDMLMAEALASKPPRTLDAVVECMDPAAEALALAHRRGVVHRDIKPANLFVVDSPDVDLPIVKVLDFGIAKVMAQDLDRAEALQRTTLTLRALSPTHAAPEQFRRSYGATGPWTDVYAFALVLVEMLRGGQPALEGDDPIALGICSCDAARRPTPRTLGVAVSDAVEAVFHKALSVSPADRYASMGEFWTSLHDAAGIASSRNARRSSASLGLAPTAPAVSEQVGVALAQAAAASASREGIDSTGAMLVGRSTPGGEPAPQGAGGAPARSRALRSLLLPGALVGLAAVGLLALRRSDAPHEAPTLAASPNAAVGSASATRAAPQCPEGMAMSGGGSYFMGSNDSAYESWRPAHKVRLSPFCIDKHEVTASAYKACSDAGECLRPVPQPDWPRGDSESASEHERATSAYGALCTFGKPGLEQHPINCVTWDQATQYCQCRHTRLPTEAEWEFAARGSDGRIYPWGDALPDEKHMNACGTECIAWQKQQRVRSGPMMYDKDDGFAGTSPVGSFPEGATMLGLQDMIGNVFEWTADYMGPYEAIESAAPKGPVQGTRRVIRGGAFNGGHPLWVNPAFRYS